MDIERLKEDIGNVEYDLEYGEEQNQGRIAVNVNCLRSVIDFANEAVARQSVKSEDNWKELREDFMHNLRGCDTVTVSLNGVGSTDYSTEDIHNMIASLTDNQVVAKSATSEEVAEAIEYLQPLIEYLQPLTGHSVMSENFVKHLKTVITALQEYQPEPPKGE